MYAFLFFILWLLLPKVISLVFSNNRLLVFFMFLAVSLFSVSVIFDLTFIITFLSPPVGFLCGSFPYFLSRTVISLTFSLLFKIQALGTSLAVQWLGLCAFTAEGAGSIPGWGTKVLQATWHGHKKQKQNKTKTKNNNKKKPKPKKPPMH